MFKERLLAIFTQHSGKPNRTRTTEPLTWFFVGLRRARVTRLHTTTTVMTWVGVGTGQYHWQQEKSAAFIAQKALLYCKQTHKNVITFDFR